MFFEKLVAFRIREPDYKLIKKICKKSQDKYENESHFVRCAILKLIREEKARLKL